MYTQVYAIYIMSVFIKIFPAILNLEIRTKGQTADRQTDGLDLRYILVQNTRIEGQILFILCLQTSHLSFIRVPPRLVPSKTRIQATY